MKPIIQIQRSLPKKAWDDANLSRHDSPHKMVPVQTTARLVHSDIKKDKKSFYLREGAYKVLVQATTHLPPSYRIVFIQGYRSLEEQRISWNNRCEGIRKNNPDLSEEEVERQACLITARPNPLANHNCGGAMDIMLEKDGELVDMGTPYISEDNVEEYKKRFPMFSKDISDEHAANRAILREAMVKAGCVFFPEEWWHYCWGDRMWAVYTGRKVYYYGPVNPDSDFEHSS